jgi:hypothetical protein
MGLSPDDVAGKASSNAGKQKPPPISSARAARMTSGESPLSEGLRQVPSHAVRAGALKNDPHDNTDVRLDLVFPPNDRESVHWYEAVLRWRPGSG